MTKRSKDLIKEVDECVSDIHERADHWNDIMQNGCSDPNWPDGVNLNLVRNHIIYCKNRLKELCEENGIFPPDEVDCEIPPKVPDNLYRGPTDTRRFELVSSWNKDLIFIEEVPLFDLMPSGQISLF